MAKKQTVDARHYDVIIAPHITEKSTLASEANAVVFKVAGNAMKINLTQLGPLVLPLYEQAKVLYSLIAKRLCSVPFALCASPEFIEREGPFRTPHDLAGLPGLVYSNVARGELVSWAGPGEPGQVALRPRVATNNGDLAAELAARGHGLVCEPRFVLAPAIEAGRLVELFADHEWPSLDLVLYPPGGPMPARLRALIDHLAAALRP